MWKPNSSQNIDTGGEALKCVDKFCYQRDLISVRGRAEASSVVRIRNMQKFRELITYPTNNTVFPPYEGTR